MSISLCKSPILNNVTIMFYTEVPNDQEYNLMLLDFSDDRAKIQRLLLESDKPSKSLESLMADRDDEEDEEP